MNEIGTINPNGVLFGRDSMLFIVSARERMEREQRPIAEAVFEGCRAALASRETRVKQLGSRYLGVFVPGRVTFHADKYTAPIRDFSAEMDRLVRLGLCDTTPRLRDAKGPPFWNTDFHFAPHGAVAIALAIGEASGFLSQDSLAFATASLPKLIEPVDHPFLGEIGMRCDPPITEPKLVFRPPIPVQGSAFDGLADLKQKHPQEGDLVIAHSPEALVDKTVVVFGTSLVNALMGPLSTMFSTVIWARTHQYVYWDVVEAANADLVVSLYSGATIDSCFPVDDADAPPFLAVSKITGRRLLLRDTNVGLFARSLPGLMAKGVVPTTISAKWRENVIGKKGFVLDENRRKHGVPVPPETVTPAPGVG